MKCIAVLLLFAGLSLALPVGKQSSEAEAQLSLPVLMRMLAWGDQAEAQSLVPSFQWPPPFFPTIFENAGAQEELAKAQLGPLALAALGGLVSGVVGGGLGAGLNRIPLNQELAQQESIPDAQTQSRLSVYFPNGPPFSLPRPTFPTLFSDNAKAQEELAKAQLGPIALAALGGLAGGLTSAGVGFGLNQIPLNEAQAQEAELAKAQLGPIALAVLGGLAGGLTSAGVGFGLNQIPLNEAQAQEAELAKAQLGPIALAVLGGLAGGLTSAGVGFGLNQIPLNEAQAQEAELAKAQLGPIALAALGGLAGGLTSAGVGFGLNQIPLNEAQVQEELAKAQLGPIALAALGGLVSGVVGGGLGAGLNRIPLNQELAQEERIPDFDVILNSIRQKLPVLDSVLEFVRSLSDNDNVVPDSTQQDLVMEELNRILEDNDNGNNSQARDQSMAKTQQLDYSVVCEALGFRC